MKTKLIYGSAALKHWFPDCPKQPKDLDFICRDKQRQPGIEYHWTDGFEYILKNNKDDTFVDPDFLYTIKVSHAAWDVHWDKTMKHIIFLKNHGCNLDRELYDILIPEWEVIHGKKKVNLKTQNKDFFKPTIKREFDHDWLHEYLAFSDRPMHEKIRKDLSSPMPSKQLWDDLSHADKLKCALEETYVIATERYLDFDRPNFKGAKIKSMKNLITSMTKGWFNLFLIENFEELFFNDMLDRHWIDKVQLLKTKRKEFQNA